jgi:glutamyl-tRNA reductase
MARRAGEALRAQGATDLAVVSRTWAHVEGLASGLDAAAIPWCELEQAVGRSDVVLCCTSAPHAVLTEELVRAACATRAGRGPLTLIDSAVPRDIDPRVRELPGVQLYDLDDLQARLRENLAQRQLETPGAAAIVTEEVQGFEDWWRGSALRPLLAAMRERAETIRRGEFERLLKKAPGLPEEARRQIEHLSRALVNKLLHEPTARLRRESDPARRGAYAEAARHLFGVAGPDVVLSDHDAS